MEIGYILAIIFAVILVGFKVAEIIRDKKIKEQKKEEVLSDKE